jgi:outer membrane lipoprotein-sorting protein
MRSIFPRMAGWSLVAVALLLATPARLPAAEAVPDGGDVLRSAVFRWMDLLQPPGKAPPQLLSGRYVMTRARGLPPEAANGVVRFHYQYPDKLRVSVTAGGEEHRFGRDGQIVWTHQPAKKFAILGKPGVARFKADPNSIDRSVVPPFELPWSKLRVRATLLLVRADYLRQEVIGGAACHVITVRPKGASLIGAENVVATLWIRAEDQAILRVAATDGGQLDVQVDAEYVAIGGEPPAEGWGLKPNEGDHTETVAVSHLLRMLEVGPRLMEQEIPALPAARGKVEVVARSGHGRLELHDGARVLFLKGTSKEMGQQHAALLKDEVVDVMERILYGVGVGSSFAKGNWFFGEVENAQARVEKFVDPRVLDEMDALAAGAGLHPQESRLANFFPELFHCSGFAITGKATKDGHLYHGRVLDYLRGVGLEKNAVTIIYQPTDGRFAWANVSYAGFVGSVTGMNEKGISIGEMGGHGYGDWDGKPMAQLVREVMEKASTLDEAIEIMRKGPRTCEYYYVIADGKTKQAVGIGATPKTFEVVKLGEAHPKLPSAIQDAVLLSAGDRYTTLVDRVKKGWGSFDADSARDLMTRPVCMNSNIQSVLFVPDTLDFYVANADSQNVASHTRYTKLNLRELLAARP